SDTRADAGPDTDAHSNSHTDTDTDADPDAHSDSDSLAADGSGPDTYANSDAHSDGSAADGQRDELGWRRQPEYGSGVVPRNLRRAASIWLEPLGGAENSQRSRRRLAARPLLELPARRKCRELLLRAPRLDPFLAERRNLTAQLVRRS